MHAYTTVDSRSADMQPGQTTHPDQQWLCLQDSHNASSQQLRAPVQPHGDKVQMMIAPEKCICLDQQLNTNSLRQVIYMLLPARCPAHCWP